MKHETPDANVTRPLYAVATAFDMARRATNVANQLAVLATDRPRSTFTSLFFTIQGSLEIHGDGTFPAVQPFLKAEKRISDRAALLGYSPTDLLGDVSGVPGGFFGHYVNHDIYANNEGDTFEVHGDIRAKYNFLGGANGILGMPVSDERGTPDGIGRYNHFKNGSIYWTPRTGAMAVWGTVRDAWAASGWELGPMGYPVNDQHRMIPIPATDPIVEWCKFENGVIAGDPRGAKIAPAASISNAKLVELVGSIVNEQFKASPDNVALLPGVESLGVSNWSITNDLHEISSRVVGFRLHGFHDNNGILTDTYFSIDLWLRFETISSFSFTEPVEKTLLAVRDFFRVKGEGGTPLGSVIEGVSRGIYKAFHQDPSSDPYQTPVIDGTLPIVVIPTGANVRTGEIDLLEVMVSAAGELQFFVNPLTPPKITLNIPFDFGHERQRQWQDKLDSM